jgi:deazaflavin-dependent oxidoreductase (nitroreductase family)
MPETKPISQKMEPLEKELPEWNPEAARRDVVSMEEMSDDAVWSKRGMNTLLVEMVGRKSGRVHKVALPYWVDDDGERIIVASLGGAPQHPQWYFNLADAEKNPRVRVKTRDLEFWAAPQVLDGDDYERVWAELVVDRPVFAIYQERCERRVPLVKLVEGDRI